MNKKKSTKKLLFQSPPLDGYKDLCKNDFSFETKLGDGAFGQVWKIKHKKTDKFYACKQVVKERVLKMLEQFRREVFIMYELSHPNIVKMFHHFEDEKKFYLIMELVEGGNLFQKLISEKMFLEKVANEYFQQVLAAVEYLHSHDPIIIHRDIKPENILLDSQGILKLTDFGWSNYYSKELGTPRYTMCGTFEYLSPEMIKESGHTPAVDIWCLGVLLYEMLCGFTPFKAPGKEILMQNISKGKIKFPNNISPLAKNLIGKILEKNPQKRYKIKDIKQHGWISFFNSKFASESRQVNEKNEDFKGKLKRISSGTTANSINDTVKEPNLNAYRKSINNIRENLEKKIENCKKNREEIKNLTLDIKNNEVLEKVIEQEIREKRKTLAESEQNIRSIYEKISDCNIQLEKFSISQNLSMIHELIANKNTEYVQKSAELQNHINFKDKLSLKLLKLNDNYTEKERYLCNLKQFFKKLRSKGTFLHKTKISQLSDLQESQAFLKNQINAHDRFIECIETPENKSIRDLLIYVKSENTKISDNFIIEDKLNSIEESICLKEVDIERIKINYLDKKSKFIKGIRGEKELIFARNSEKELIAIKLKNAINIKDLFERELDKSRAIEKKYMLESIELSRAREKFKVLLYIGFKSKINND